MKKTGLFLATLSLLAASQAGAVVLIGPTTINDIAAVSVADLGTITNAQVAGYNQLVISYSVSTSGGGWLGLSINPPNAADPVTHLTSANTNLGALVRTQSGDQHQLFTGSTPGGQVQSAPHGTATNSAVQIYIDITNGFSGTSSVSFRIDEGSDTFVTADHTLATTMTWTEAQARFTVGALDSPQNLTNFTVQAVPETGSAALAMLGGLAFLRRKRA